MSDKPLIVWPPIIQDYLAWQQQAQPCYERPQPPLLHQRSCPYAAWIGIGTILALLVGMLLLSNDRPAQLVGFLGLLGMGWGIRGLWHSFLGERSHTQQEQWRDYQSCLRQWENAQKLLRRSRKRQLRQLLAGKVLSPTAKKAVCPNQCQKTLVTSLKRHCPQLSAYLGWEFAFEEEVFHPALALVDERTGLSLVVVIDLTPAWQKFFNEGNWAIVRVSKEQMKKPTDFGALVAKAITVIDE